MNLPAPGGAGTAAVRSSRQAAVSFPSDRMFPARGPLLEAPGFHRAAMKEPLLPAVVANKSESSIPHQTLNRAVRHVDFPPQTIP